MASSQERKAVRAAGRTARNAISGPERVRREAALVAHLRSLQALEADSVGVFIAHDGEPDLMPLVDYLWSQGRVVALPTLADDPDDRTMTFRTWRPEVDLVAGRYGIPVPPAALSRTVSPLCLLVSLTAFDATGNRMGRGAGFFDRYLASSNAQVVGVGFETQRVPEIPVEEHDVPMPILVTDLGTRFLA